MSPLAQVILTLVPVVALLINACAFIMNAYATRRANRQMRAAIVTDTLKELITDPDIQEAFYLVAYDRFRYDEHFHQSPVERSMDKMLRAFANLALLWKARLVSLDDIMPIKYYLLLVYGHAHVRSYVEVVRQFSAELHIDNHPFTAFVELAQRLEHTTQRGRK